jgi:enamine deaminase RidA (YjgF/YER057c/UK114 family)
LYKEVPEVGLSKIFENDFKMGLIKPVYKIITPDQSGDFSIQWQSCLSQLEDISVHSGLSPVRINIFVKSTNHNDYLAQHDLVEKSMFGSFGSQCPPFGTVMQEPEDPFLVIIEAGFINRNAANVIYGTFKQRPYCIVDAKNYKEYWTIGAQSVHPDKNILASSNASFSYLYELYNYLGLSFNNIVRQWNYVGEILSKENIDNRLRQHYQMFNETRSIFYKKNRSRTDFPAATGIGMLYLGVCIDSFAVSGNENLVIVAISNPSQNESYKYGQQVLVGAPDCSLPQNQPPQFERAKLIMLNNVSRLIISGTASIIGQETIGIGDVEKQTQVTIENIQRLSDPDTLKNQCPGIKVIPASYSYVRVYVKFKKDISKVRKICSNFFGNVPTTYVVADICRDNLLVEIETELIS